MLADIGFEMVGPAFRVSQALELVDTEVFDAAVVDINLGGTKSFPVADALAARGIPFIFATGYDRLSLPTEYQRFSCLRKPYRISDLHEALRQIMEGRSGNTV